MARLVVYGSSIPCPDMVGFRWWLTQYNVPAIEVIDIHREEWAYDRVVSWTGHASVPTLVIAPDDSLDPVSPPVPLAPGQRVRALDRGSMLTEPNPGQIEGFLRRNGVQVVALTEPESLH